MPQNPLPPAEELINNNKNPRRSLKDIDRGWLLGLIIDLIFYIVKKKLVTPICIILGIALLVGLYYILPPFLAGVLPKY